MINKETIKDEIYLLGIETSCDESSAAVVKARRGQTPEILCNIIHSQIEIHRKFGGVVPEIASRNHTMAMPTVVDEALTAAGVTLDDIGAIGVTYGAGLLGALLVGVSYAKGLAFAKNLPLIKVNHIEAHVAATFLNAAPPFISLVVSGGHTMILHVRDYYNYDILTETLDDAAGEAFDKVARVLNLPYPGGPEINRLALSGCDDINFFKNSSGIVCADGFSYSGLKTAVINYLNTKRQKNDQFNINDICASFQKQALLPLVFESINAAKKLNLKTVTIAGGVSANTYLREKMASCALEHGLKAHFPPHGLSTDNAAMVAVRAAYDYFEGKNPADLKLNAVSVIPFKNIK